MVANAQAATVTNQQLAFKMLLKMKLHAPSRADTVRIWLAILTQAIGAFFVVLYRKDVELVVLIEAIALAVAGWLVGECEHIDPRWWARFLAGATVLSLIESAILLMMRGKP